MSVSKFVFCFLALISAAATQHLEETPDVGSTKIVNNMGSTIYMWSVADEQVPMMTIPPGGSYRETYCFHPNGGGVSIRLQQVLCTNARASCLKESNKSPDPTHPRSPPHAAKKSDPVQSSLSDVRNHILELIGAVEWLVAMAHSAAIVTSRSHNCTTPTRVYINASVGSSPQTTEILQNANNLIKQQHGQEIEESILARARANVSRVTTLWGREISDDVVARAVSQAGSVAVLMWNKLALLTLATERLRPDEVDYEEVHRHYTALITLINLWRSIFGQVDRTAATSLQQARPDVLRSVSFCSIDVDLSILLLYERIHQLEVQLTKQTSSLFPPARERLWNALQSGSA
jgi:hypothetical protein